jgi:hypothetical protein
MLEQFVYESRPFAFLATAIAAHVHAPNTFTNVFATVLGACMLIVLYWRYENRFMTHSPARKPQRRK